MIDHPSFGAEPWVLREHHLDLAVLQQTESLFALSNGHIGFRANLDEGEPNGIPGTYLNSVYEDRPLPYAEAGYGYPESGQTVINVTNGKLIRLLVDDEPFDVRYGRLLHHERSLDMKSGVLDRRAEWTSPMGKTVRVRSSRLVSLTHRAVAAIHYEVEAVDPVSVVLQSELVANESLPDTSSDPRSAVVLDSPLAHDETVEHRCGAVMVHHTRSSGLAVAAGMDNLIEGPEGTETDIEASGDVARVTVVARLEAGQTLRLVKLVAYGWSAIRTRPALRDQVVAALAEARHLGWEGLRREQRLFLDEFWAGADVEIDGDPQVQQAVRFGLFHIVAASARAETRPIPAKGLTGPGYDGHSFWDSEVYVLPVLTFTHPAAAADALRWRLSTLPAAEARARSLGLEGAAFAWRTIDGGECSSYWPAGTAAFHINADIADAALRYLAATGDDTFEAEVALPLLVATARLWRCLGSHDRRGAFRIDGVTGPDEYSAVADNNVYTNLLAEQNLREAARLVADHPERAGALGVSAEEAAAWRDAASAMVVPYDEHLGVHPQSERFTDHEVWDFAATPAERYPLMLHFPYFDLYRKQVCKQADLVLAMMLRGDRFSADQKRRNFDYYEAITVRDSSLSAAPQAVVAAEVGHLDLAYGYLEEAALMDLQDLEHNTRDGLHMASLAGSWTALVMGFGGMRTPGGRLCFSPRLPEALEAVRFRVRWQGSSLEVAVTPAAASYRVTSGPPFTLSHHGEELRVGPDRVSRPLPAPKRYPPPRQPHGRAPGRRSRSNPAEP